MVSMSTGYPLSPNYYSAHCRGLRQEHSDINWAKPCQSLPDRFIFKLEHILIIHHLNNQENSIVVVSAYSTIQRLSPMQPQRYVERLLHGA